MGSSPVQAQGSSAPLASRVETFCWITGEPLLDRKAYLVYCTVVQHRKAGYTAMPDADSNSGFSYDFWVCAECHLPSRMVFDKLTDSHAPQRATYIKSVVGDAHGRNFLTWGTAISGEKIVTMMFHAYPRKVDMDQGRNICLELWTGLDSFIDEIRDVRTHEYTRADRQIEARILAKVIALIMSPFYEDQTAVLRESMTRWTARQNGTEHESPGLAEAVWDPNLRFDGTPFSNENLHRVPSGGATVVKTVELDETKIRFIKHSLETGVMSAEVLAGMFACSIDDIKAAADA